MLRNQGPEFFEDLPFTALVGDVTPKRELPHDKWLLGLHLMWEGRVGVTVAAPGAVLTEAPQSIIERIRVEGQHNRLGQRDFYNLRGATAYAYANVYGGGRNLSVTSSPALANAIGNYDIRAHYLIWFPPEQIPLSQQIAHAIRGDDWKTLNMHISFGDRTSLFNAATGTVAFTAFGSATGAPRLSVHMIRPLLGNARDAIRPALVRRQFQELTTVFTQTNLTDGFIAKLEVGKKYRSALIKAGVRATAAPPSAGVNVFVSLSDDIVARPKIALDGKNIRDAISNYVMKEFYAYAFRASLPAGYTLLDFVDGGDIRTIFPAQGLGVSNRFELRGDVVVAANQQGELVETLIEGEPFVAS